MCEAKGDDELCDKGDTGEILECFIESWPKRSVLFFILVLYEQLLVTNLSKTQRVEFF